MIARHFRTLGTADDTSDVSMVPPDSLIAVTELLVLLKQGQIGGLNDRQEECVDAALSNCIRLRCLIEDLLKHQDQPITTETFQPE